MFSIQTGFQQSLIPASYNGVPFFVIDTGIKSGNRAAIHSYPFRDTPFVEPLGKDTRMFSFTAFLVGDAPDLQLQYSALLSAIETRGPGTLVHPVFGQQTVVPLAAEFQQNTAGRYVEVRLQFAEAGSVIYPSLASDTSSDSIQIADQAQSTNIDRFNFTTGNSTSGSGAPEGLPDSNVLNPTTGMPAQTSANDFGDTAVQSGADFGFGTMAA